jgi:hypothetical protein
LYYALSIRSIYQGEIASLYAKSAIGPSEFALWKPKSDIELSFNNQVRFIGSELASSKEKSRLGRLPILSNKSLTSDSILALAKQRLKEMDFVGLSSRFMESMEVMSWKLGIPLYHMCSCNLNPFKQRVTTLKTTTSGRGGGGGGGILEENRLRLNDKAKAEVIKDNYLDMQLYEFAEELFEKDYQDYVDYMEAFREVSSQSDSSTSSEMPQSSKSRSDGGLNKVVVTSNKEEMFLKFHNLPQIKRRNSFVCDTKAMKCRGYQEKKDEWIDVETYKLLYEKDIKSGRANSCSYECTRKQLL